MGTSQAVLWDGYSAQVLSADLTHWVSAPFPPVAIGHFEQYSTNNHWRYTRSHELTGDRGSSWTAFKSEFETNGSCEFIGRDSGVYGSYRGPLMVHDDNSIEALDFQQLNFGASDEGDLLGLGATAISRVIPTNPVSDMPTAVGELFTEGLPNAIGHGIRTHGGVSASIVSGEYLNVVFGIQPFWRDIQAFLHASQRAEKLIDDYASHSGKKLRRRYDFPEDREGYTTVYPNTGFEHNLAGINTSSASTFAMSVRGGDPGIRTDTVSRSKKTWFSGAFTYYLPAAGRDFSSRLLREEAEMRHLYGGLSIDTAWNLLPYSWAADWFTNAGDVIHNISAFSRDGLVMPYGYVMEQCEVHEFRKVEGAFFGSVHPDTSIPQTPIPQVVTSTLSAKYMRRRKATPFGFGLDSSGFTTRQWSILAALGLSRVP